MILTQYYLGCLSHASYLVGDESTGRAVVVDPQRDVSGYLTDAEAAGLRIERVIETHFHADFVSGHLELADRTGAVISYGAAAQGRVEFPMEPLADEQRLSLGTVALEVRATPGHTPESISIVVYERADDEAPHAVLTGDTLFIGDVGRPDLLASGGATADSLARQLRRSLHEQLLTLPDTTLVYPAHGAGSACGKQLSAETVSTIGEQRVTNYALAAMSEAEFVELVTEGQLAAPPYFAFDADRNRQARDLLDEEAPPAALGVERVLALQRHGAVVLDTRDPPEYASAHLERSLNVGLGGRFAEYVGAVVAHDRDLVLVTEPGAELEAKLRLGRIGFDRVVGTLAEPARAFLERPEAVRTGDRYTGPELVALTRQGSDLQLVDVRGPGETAGGVIPGAVTIPLATLVERAADLDPSRPTVVYCASGYRSSIARSTLEAVGFHDVADLLGGFDGWTRAGLPVAAAPAA